MRGALPHRNAGWRVRPPSSTSVTSAKGSRSTAITEVTTLLRRTPPAIISVQLASSHVASDNFTETGQFIASCFPSLTLKGSRYRLKETGIDTLPIARAEDTAQ